MEITHFSTGKGYLIVPRSLLLKMFEEHAQASGDEEAFLRVLAYVNYKDAEMDLGCGQKIFCQRGDSLISFLGWGNILGWGRTHVRRFFGDCFSNGYIVRVQDGYPSHIRIPNYDAWISNSRVSLPSDELFTNVPVDPSGSALHTPFGNPSDIPAETSATPPPPPSGASPSAPTSACSPAPIDLRHFMEHYSEVTQTPLLNIGRAQRYWNQLTADERHLAYDQVEDYYLNLPDIHYCMQASTYLHDKAYLNRYDY